MKRVGKLLLGLGAFYPLVSAVLMGAYIAYRLISFDLAQPGGGSGNPIEAIEAGALDTTDLVLFVVMLGLTVIIELGMALIFAIHAVKDPRHSSGAKAAWIIALVLLAPFAFPAYFVLYVLREPIPQRVADLQSAPIAS